MAGTAAGPRSSFDCLWCGRSWSTRSPDDLEGWAQLCPDCLGRAGDNPFLRFRLRDALAARAAAAKQAPSDPAVAAPPPVASDPAADDLVVDDEAGAADSDDWYLRRGRYARGPIHDAAWDAELDGAGAWLDGLPIRGEIVELAAGTGWWSPLLAGKGELWLYDAAEAPLERARERLLAHRLRAHLHVRDAWSEPDRRVDALVCNFWLSRVARGRTGAFLELAHRWLKPGGTFAFIDSLPDLQSGADHPAVKVFRTPDELEGALRAAGFGDVSVTTTGRFFLLGRGRA